MDVDLRTLRRGAVAVVVVEVGCAVARVGRVDLDRRVPWSRAYIAVTMLSAVFEDGYGTLVRCHSGLEGLVMAEMEPTSLETLTMRAARARLTRGSIALVVATTPKTLVS